MERMWEEVGEGNHKRIHWLKLLFSVKKITVGEWAGGVVQR